MSKLGHGLGLIHMISALKIGFVLNGNDGWMKLWTRNCELLGTKNVLNC
jgi:hypothetical protein